MKTIKILHLIDSTQSYTLDLKKKSTWVLTYIMCIFCLWIKIWET